jgi:hypothetical protein
MSDTHLDVEETYDIDRAFALPDLTDQDQAPAYTKCATHLDTLYYDTADLRLTTCGATLRRRVGGTHSGWQLRLPNAENAGYEMHRPLCGPIGGPPDTFLRQVRVWVEYSDLRPVARIRTERVIHTFYDPHTRSMAAQVRDDQVSAEVLGDGPQTSRWRELRIRAIDGDGRLLHHLGRRLLDAGAQPTTNPYKLARALGPRLDGARAHRKPNLGPGTLSPPDEATAVENSGHHPRGLANKPSLDIANGRQQDAKRHALSEGAA